MNNSQCIQQIIKDKFLVPSFQLTSFLVATYGEVHRYVGTENNEVN